MKRTALLFIFLGTCSLTQADPELYWALANNDALQVWNLTQEGEVSNSPLPNGELPAAWAIERGSRDALEVLISRGADLALKDSRGRPLIFLAAEAGRSDLIDLLVKRGATLNIQDDRGETFAQAAAGASDERMILVALKNGIDVLSADHLGKTPLMAASAAGSLASVQLLIKEGSDPDLRDYLGRRASDYAKLAGHTDVEQFLKALETPDENPVNG